MSLRIDTIPNRQSKPQILLRQPWREEIRVRQMTLANFTNLPQPLIEGFKAVLKGGTMFTQNDDAVTVEQSLPHSHMTAALGMVRALELPRPLHRQN